MVFARLLETRERILGHGWAWTHVALMGLVMTMMAMMVGIVMGCIVTSEWCIYGDLVLWDDGVGGCW